ncbi:MAG: class I SAM-dependent methyltransferase [Candidatus Omnitrophica bacterium]|nr:class I SAM-dependent methyltransferase [Candidatus Omnitrophota bacterium]
MPASDLYQKKECRYCGTRLPAPFLDLGTIALANSYVPVANPPEEEFKCPLQTALCPSCALVQLTHVVPPDLMFRNYFYVSSTTQTFKAHFAEYAKTARKKLGKKTSPLAVDIGSNDGALLALYQQEGMRAVGVDPATNLAREANVRGLRTFDRYFDASCVQEIITEFGKADVISANNVFAHIDDIQSVCRNVFDLLDEEGIFVIEFPYLGTMLDKMYFDMIYHEHLSYIAVSPLQFLLSRFHMEIFDIQEVESHGGSLRIYIKKKSANRRIESIVTSYIQEEKRRNFSSPSIYEEFARKVIKTKEELVSCIGEIKAEGKTVAGYGAPAKASTIVNFCELTNVQIDFIVDDNPMKQNNYVPGARIPIVSSQHLEKNAPDYILIFAWNFAKEILSKIGHYSKRGTRFLVPLPHPDEIIPHP